MRYMCSLKSCHTTFVFVFHFFLFLVTAAADGKNLLLVIWFLGISKYACCICRNHWGIHKKKNKKKYKFSVIINWFLFLFLIGIEYFALMLTVLLEIVKRCGLNTYNNWYLNQSIALDYQSTHVPMPHLHIQPDDFQNNQYPMKLYHFVHNDYLRCDRLDIPTEHLHHPTKFNRNNNKIIIFLVKKCIWLYFAYLTCINAWLTTSTNERWIQTKFLGESCGLQCWLTLIEWNDWQWHLFHNHTVFARFAKHIFSPATSKTLLTAWYLSRRWQANRSDMIVQLKWIL